MNVRHGGVRAIWGAGVYPRPHNVVRHVVVCYASVECIRRM